MKTGLFFLTTRAPSHIPEAGACLVKVPGWNDFWGEGWRVAAGCRWRLARGMFRGLHNPEDVAAAATLWSGAGYDWQDGNEPNHPVEGYNTTPGVFAVYCGNIAVRSPKVRRWFPAPSPGIKGWEDWLSHPDIVHLIKDYYQGVAVHAYGNHEEFKTVLETVEDILPGIRKVLAEHNPGWGRPVGEYGGLERWTRDELPKNMILARDMGYEAFIYYCMDGYHEPGQPEDLSATEEITRILLAGIGSIPATVERVVTEQEFEKLAREQWGGFSFTPTFAIPREWIKQAKAGRWMGAPTTAERMTTNGRYVYQLFTGGAIWCEKDIWVPHIGLPPFE